MRPEGRLGGVLILTFAIAYFIVGLSMPRSSLGDPLGARAFPLVLGGLLVLLGLSLAVAPVKVGGGAAGSGRPSMKAAALAVLLCVYGYTLPLAGYLVGTILFIGITAYLLGERSWRLLIGLSAGVSVGVYLLFTQVLDIPLPAGLLEFMKG